MKKLLVALLSLLVFSTVFAQNSLKEFGNVSGGLFEPLGGEIRYDDRTGTVIVFGFAGAGFIGLLLGLIVVAVIYYKYKYSKKKNETGDELELFSKYQY